MTDNNNNILNRQTIEDDYNLLFKRMDADYLIPDEKEKEEIKKDPFKLNIQGDYQKLFDRMNLDKSTVSTEDVTTTPIPNTTTTPIPDTTTTSIIQKPPPRVLPDAIKNFDIDSYDWDVTVQEKEPEEDRTQTEEDMRKDKKWIKNIRTIYNFQNPDNPWSEKDGTDRDLATWGLNRMSRLGHNFTNIGMTAATIKNMPEDVQRAWIQSISQYEPSAWSWRGFFKGLGWSIADVPTALSFGTFALAKVLGGRAASVLTKLSFRETLKKELAKKIAAKKGKKALTTTEVKEAQKIARKITRPYQYGASGLSAGAYGGIFDMMYQNFKEDVSKDLPEEEQYKYNNISTLINTGLATSIGLAIPFAGRSIGSKLFDDKAAQRIVDEEEYIIDTLREIGKGEETSSKNTDFISNLTRDDIKELSSNQVLPERNKKGEMIKGEDKPHKLFEQVLEKQFKTGKNAGKYKGKDIKALSWGPGQHIEKTIKTDRGNIIDDGGKALGKDGKPTTNKDKQVQIPYNDVPERKQVQKSIDKVFNQQTDPPKKKFIQGEKVNLPNKKEGIVVEVDNKTKLTKVEDMDGNTYNVETGKLLDLNQPVKEQLTLGFDTIKPSYKLYDLEEVRENAPEGTFVDESYLGKGDHDAILAANWLGQLPDTKAKGEIERIADTLNNEGSLVINTGNKKSVLMRDKSEFVTELPKELRDGKTRDVKGKTGRFTEKAKVHTKDGVDGFLIEKYKTLGISDEALEKTLKTNFKNVIKDGNIFVAKNKRKKALNESNPANIKKNVKTKNKPIAVIPKDKRQISWFDEWFSQSAGLPAEIHASRIAKNAIGEIVKRSVARKVNLFNRQKEKIKTINNKSYKEMTDQEKEYLGLLADMILRGGGYKLQNREGRFNLLQKYDAFRIQPELETHFKGIDPFGKLPDGFIKNLVNMRDDITKAQEKAMSVGLIEKGSDLHVAFERSMGTFSDDFDLHLNRQYRIIDEPENWAKTIVEKFPERIEKAKIFFKNEIQSENMLTTVTPDNKEVGFAPALIVREINDLINLRLTKGYKNAENGKPDRRIGSEEKALRLENRLRNERFGGLAVTTQMPVDKLKILKEEFLDDEAGKLVNRFLRKYTDEEVSVLKDFGFNPKAFDVTDIMFLNLDHLKPGKKGDKMILPPDSDTGARSIFFRRKKIPPEIRSLMGEYKDPAYNYVNTLLKLRQSIETYKFEDLVARMATPKDKGGMGVLPNAVIPKRLIGGQLEEASPGFKSLSEATALPKYTPGIRLPYKPDGKEIYVPDVVFTAIKDGNHHMREYVNPAIKGLIIAQAYSRMAVTALRPAGYPRNYLGAMIKSISSGNVSIGAAKEAHKLFSAIGNFDNIDMNNFIIRQQYLGLLGQSTRAADLRAQFKDAGVEPIDYFSINNFTENLPKGKDTAWLRTKQGEQWIMDRYQLMDDVWRTYNFIAERKRYKPIVEEDFRTGNIDGLLGSRKLTVNDFNNDEVAKYTTKNFPGKKVGDLVPNEPEIVTFSNGYKVGLAADTLGDGGKTIEISNLDTLAGKKVRAHMDNYAELSKGIKWARGLPIADFLGYKAEQVRTTKDIFKTAIQDIKRGIKLQSDSKGEYGGMLYIAGLKRLGAIMAGLTLGPSLAGTMGYVFLQKNKENFNPDIIRLSNGEKIKNFYSNAEGRNIVEGPEYALGTNRVAIGPPDKDGTYPVLDYDRLNPWGPITTSISAILNEFYLDDETLMNKIDNVGAVALKKIYEELGPTMVAKAAFNALNGQDEFGKPVANPNDPDYIKAKEALLSAANVFLPGFIRDPVKVYKAFKESQGKESLTPFGGFKNNPIMATLNAFGFAGTYNEPKNSLRFKIQPEIKEIKSASQRYLSELGKYTRLEPDTILEQYEKALQQDMNAKNSLILKFMAANATGLTKKQIQESITKGEEQPSLMDKNLKHILSKQGYPISYQVPKSLNYQNKGIMTKLRVIAKQQQPTVNYKQSQINQDYEYIKSQMKLIHDKYNNNKNYYEYYKNAVPADDNSFDWDLRLY